MLAFFPLSLLASLLPSPQQSQALVNAPVAPEAIYVGRAGDRAGLSIVDLNGFGQGTGNPSFDPNFSSASEGMSMFPFDPNVQFQGPLLNPPLVPGSTSLDGGSAGIFTLTRDSSLSNLLVPGGGIGTPGDMMLGWPLDLQFNNGVPFGCQSGGGSLCSNTGLKVVGPAASAPDPVAGPVPLQFVPGGTGAGGQPGLGNPISWAPYPNPPRLLSIPLCQTPEILGQEPTSIDNALVGLVNLLVPGNPFGNPALGIPPTGLLGSTQRGFFFGPSPPQSTIVACRTYQMRQQVGHYLYIIDRSRREVAILNSNRMTVLGRIPLPDPTELAMDPNLNFLAVTNRDTDSVTLIDIQPASPRFHQVIKTVRVGNAPVGIAWQPDDEDILVCNSGDSTLSILNTSTFAVRKTVRVGHAGCFALAVTPRHTTFGSRSGVYYAFLLDRSGRVSLFESGPNGVNGIGYDDVVTTSAFRLRRASTLQLDPLDPADSVWIVHSSAADREPVSDVGGAITQLRIEHPLLGPAPIIPGSPPSARGKTLRIARTIGPDVLTGRPMDLAFDNLSNLGVFPNPSTVFSARPPAPINGKHPMRAASSPLPTNRATMLFLAVRGGAAGRGAVDVIDLSTGLRVDTNPFQAGVQSIPAPGARILMDYFRQ